MFEPKFSLSLIAALAIGTAAIAQDAAEGEVSDAPAGGEQIELSMGEQEQPKAYVRETEGDWEIKCFGTGGENDVCQMYQLLKDDTDNAVSEFSLFRLDNGTPAAAGATVVVPLETLLTQQLSISIDGGEARKYPFAYCNQAGCYARLGLTAEDVTAQKAGAKGTMTIVPAAAPNQTVKATISLTGFTAAYDKVTTLKE